MEKILFERTAALRLIFGAYRQSKRRALDKRRAPTLDPRRRIRIALYAARAMRGVPLFG